MSKTPAPKVPAKKKPAGKAARPAPVAKKPAAKTASKKAPVKRPVPAPKPKPAPAPARAKPAAAPAIAAKRPAAVKSPIVKPAPAPVVPPPALAAAPKPAVVPSKKAARNAAKYGAPMVQAPLPPPTSRFADRFAPPRPPTRQMNNLELDTPRHAHKHDPKLANAWKGKAGRDLAEAEVLAMPDSEYMNDKQLEFFRFKLQTLKDDLLSNAGETTEHLAKTPRSFPTRPIARPSRRSTRSSCAPATASASC